MVPPVITQVPTPPNRADAPADFSAKADAFVASFPVLVVQLNASFSWVADQVTAVDGYRQAAAASAQTATEQAAIATSAGGVAEQQIARAKAYADNAKASATAAEAAPGSIGNLALMHSVALSF